MKRVLVAVFVVAIPFLAYWGMKAPAVDRYLARQLPEWARSRGFELRVESLDFDPWGPSVRVTGLRVQPETGEWAAAARSLRVQLLPHKSLSGVPHLEVEAEAPSFAGEMRARPSEQGERGDGGAPTGVLETLRVSEGSISLSLPEEDLAVELPSVEIDWVENRGTAVFAGGEIAWRGGEEEIRRLAFEGRRRFAAVRVERLEVDTQRTHLTASGRFGPWGLLDLGAEARLDLRDPPAPWIEALGLGRFAPVRAEVAVSGHLEGTVERPVLKGEANLAQARFGPIDVRSGSVDFTAEREGLRFENVSTRTNAGGVDGVEGRLSWGDGVRLEAHGQVIEYDLRQFMALFRQGHFPVGVAVTGRFEAEGPLHPEMALGCWVDVQARNLDVTTGPAEHRITRFRLPSARVASRCTVGRREVRFGPSRVETDTVSVEIPSGRVEYRSGLWFETDVAVRGLDLVRQYMPEGFDARGQARGNFGGPYRELAFRYDVDLDSAVVLGENLGRLRAQAEYDLRDLVLQKGQLEGPVGRAEVSGVAGLRPEGTYDLAVSASEVDLGGVARFVGRVAPGRIPEVSGTGWASGKLSGPLGVPVFDGAAGVRDVSIQGVRVDAVEAQGKASPRAWTLSRGTLRALGAEASVSGRGDRVGFDLQGSLVGLDSASLVPDTLGSLPLEGTFDGAFDLSGAYANPSVNVAGRVRGASAYDHELGDLDVSLRLEDRRLRVGAEGLGGAAVARGELDLAEGYPYTAAAEAKNLSWSILPDGLAPANLGADSVTGRLDLSGRLGVEAKVDAARWSGYVAGVRWGDVVVGRVGSEAEFKAGGLSLDLEAWQGEARVSGLLSPETGAPLGVDLSLDGFSVAHLGDLAPAPEGRVWAKGSALVSLAEWNSLQGLERLAALADLELEGRVAGLATGAGEELPAWSFRVASPSGLPRVQLSSEGIEVDGALQDLKSATWRAVARLQAFEPARWLPAGYAARDVRGTLTGEVTARGSALGLAEASGEGRLEGLAWGAVAPSQWGWRLEWSDGQAVLEAREPRGVSVGSRWSPGADLALDVVLNSAPLEGWVQEDLLPMEIAGTVTGRADLRLPPGELPEGRVVVSELDLRAAGESLRNRGDIVVGSQGGDVTIHRLALVGEGVEASGSGRFRPGKEWDLEANALLDLSVLSRWLPQVSAASGTGWTQITVKGPWSAPNLEGPLEIRQGATLALEGIEYPLEDLDARGYLDRSQGLTVEWVDAQFGPGRVHLEGVIGLVGLWPERLRIAAELRDVTYEGPPQVSYTFDADLLVTGTVAQPEVRGELRLDEFVYARRLNWKTMVFELLRRRPRQVKGITQEEGVFVDLSVRGAENLRVENNLADLSLGVDLRARGYLSQPVLWGRVDVTDGTVRFRSQEYEVLQSSVEFLGETQLVPLLDVHARTSVQQYTVNVDITGTVDDYQVTLSSIPPLPQTDVVALLTLGTTADEMEGGESVSATEAASFLTGRIQDELESGVGSLLGFDELHIDPAYSPAAQTTVPRVTVGKSITQALRARYSASIGGEAEQDVEVQYTVNPRLSLLGTWNDRGPESRGSLGGEVRFRFTFR